MGKSGNVVYFLQRRDGLIKIGHTSDFGTRKAVLESEYGPLVCLGYLSGGAEVERVLHKAFFTTRINGEWFAPSQDLSRFLERETHQGLPEENGYRPRKRLNFWLRTDEDNDAELLVIIDLLKSQKQFVRAIKWGLREYWNRL